MKKLLETLKRKLSSSDEQEASMQANQDYARFTLFYESLVIGTLTADKGVWTFEYSEEFKKQNAFKPLVNFPDKSKVYTQDTLWPFFASRIPGVSQPRVQEVLKAKNIDSENTVDLLKIFGKHSISNPFELVVQ